MKTNNKPSIAIAMSGGIDSSVAAAILVQEGYQVFGFTFLLWNVNEKELDNESVTKAKHVCKIIGIPHYTLDLREEFNREVVNYFEEEYLAGRTPNPCVRCNARIKFRLLWKKAQEYGFEKIATGHYAKLEIDQDNSLQLLKGIDIHKDQSYFLWQIPDDLLRRTIFPLGGKTKVEVRAIAHQLGFPIAEESESKDVCFIPDNDYRGWLQHRRPEVDEGLLAGEMVDTSGKVLGVHSGSHLFTIGQRKGLGLGGGRKLYVISIDPLTHRVCVGDESELNCSEFTVGSVKCLTKELFDNPDDLQVKIRYRDPGVPATVKILDRNQGCQSTVIDSLLVSTIEPVKAVTPGQSAVFYRGDQVLGGGIIL
ncbi:MAG: tRNA 2-thiouridine(34) synthase MnmA [Candidatus Hatepunaea meridiana]|nr:tRNA 2-thiouridine(34) synthase MnmA [Candidatus Hatepunaea meridiana]